MGPSQSLASATGARYVLQRATFERWESLTEPPGAGAACKAHKRPVSPASVRGVTSAAASPAEPTGSAEEPPPPHAYLVLYTDRGCFPVEGRSRMRDLDKELTSHGAREVDILLFRPDPERALAAVDAAVKQNADNVVRYAMSLFEDPAWRPAKPAKQTNLHGTLTDCELCGGDKFVLVRTRPQQVTAWMEQHGRVPSETEEHEEYAACPACNPTTDTSHWRYDGTRAQALDPARVRELISRA